MRHMIISSKVIKLLIAVVLVGSCEVGKTCLWQNYVKE